MEARRKQAIAAEIRQSQVKELVKPTFNKTAWGKPQDQLIVKPTSLVLKTKKLGFDKSVWRPPVQNSVVEEAAIQS